MTDESWGLPEASRDFKTNGFSGGALNAQLNFWEKQSQVSAMERQGPVVNSGDREGDPQVHISELQRSVISAQSLQAGIHCRTQLSFMWSQAVSLAALQQVSWQQTSQRLWDKMPCHASFSGGNIHLHTCFFSAPKGKYILQIQMKAVLFLQILELTDFLLNSKPFSSTFLHETSTAHTKFS